jgi:hypothetical protein
VRRAADRTTCSASLGRQAVAFVEARALRDTSAALAALLLVHRSTVAEQVRVVNQLQALHTTAPLALRERIGPGNGAAFTARLRKMHARPHDTAPERLIFDLLRELAGRAHALAELAARYRAQLAELTMAIAPRLLVQPGVEPVSAAQLLICDARRFRNEAASHAATARLPSPRLRT